MNTENHKKNPRTPRKKQKSIEFAKEEEGDNTPEKIKLSTSLPQIRKITAKETMQTSSPSGLRSRPKATDAPIKIESEPTIKKSSYGLKKFFKKEKKSEPIPIKAPTTIVASCFDDLPEDIKEKVNKLELDTKLIDEHFFSFMSLLQHITNDYYELPDGKKVPSSEKKANVSEEMQMKAKEVIATIDREKEGKKMFKPIESSGKGGFGNVFCAKETQTKAIVAVKRLKHLTDFDIQLNFSEVACLITFKHANIVMFRSAWIVFQEMWIVTEYMEGGSLSEAIKVHNFKENHIAYIGREILKGLSFLHEKQFAHRDIKSHNIMLSTSGNVKIIDFGLCADISEGERLQSVGTHYWMSPEMITKKPHGVKTDIWSFGIVITEMYLKSPPYCKSRMMALFKAITNQILNCLDDFKVQISGEAKSFLKRTLVVNPEKRSSADELLKHEFVTKKKLEENLITVLRTIFVSNTLAKSGYAF